jgi:hypothetical protein
MSTIAKFSFVGTTIIPKSDSKKPFFKEIPGKNKKKMISMNFGIKETDNNMAFVEAFDSEQDVIKTINTDNQKIEIDWKDRFDEEVIKSVANYKKYTVDLGNDCGGRKEFISQYDALLYLNEWLPKFKGRVVIIGQLIKEWYKDQFYDKFKFQNIYAANDEQKNRLSLTIDIYYNKDSVDKSDYKDNKKIYINGYINQYINKDEKNKYIPHQFIFNSSKYDEGNPKHQKLLEYKLKYIDIKNKNIVHCLWEVRLIRGAEEVDFNESMLTSEQKEQIELGIRTLEEFKPKGIILGSKVNEYRLFDPKLVNEFAEGLVELDMPMSEFAESIYVPVKEEKLDDVMKKAEEKQDETVDDEDLF